MVLTVSFVLSPVTGLVCHRRQRNRFRQLDASVGASGPHDFAVRLKRPRQKRHPRPPHPEPYVRDDRETPLGVGRDDGNLKVIWVAHEQKYFCERDSTEEANQSMSAMLRWRPMLSSAKIARSAIRSAINRLIHRVKSIRYSITSSARARRVEGTVMPSVLAVLRFITSSYLVGCRIGRSLGLAPLRSFPT